MIELIVIPIVWFYLYVRLSENVITRFISPFLPILFALFSMSYFPDFISYILILSSYKTLGIFFKKKKDPLSEYVHDLLNYAVPLFSDLDAVIYLLVIIISKLIVHILEVLF